jgi:hypothetical protein
MDGTIRKKDERTPTVANPMDFSKLPWTLKDLRPLFEYLQSTATATLNIQERQLETFGKMNENLVRILTALEELNEGRTPLEKPPAEGP